MFKVDTEATEKSLLKAQKTIENALEGMVRKFAVSVIEKASENTPLGDHITNADWYELRESETGLKPIQGIARGSWDLAVNEGLSLPENYGAESSSIAVNDAISQSKSFKLGNGILIGNKRDYVVGALEGGYSPQAPMGIMQPTTNEIESAYRSDLQRFYSSSKEGV